MYTCTSKIQLYLSLDSSDCITALVSVKPCQIHHRVS